MALSKIDVSKMITGVTPLTNGGTGGTSIPATNLASGVTGTLPVPNGGTGIASGTTDQILKFTGSTTIASAAEAAGGKLLQSQNATFTSGVTSVTSTTLTATEVTDQITPSASSSKILVILNASLSQYEGSGSGITYKAGLYRQINGGGYSRVYAGQGNSYGGFSTSAINPAEIGSSFPTTLTFIDSPNTTNAVDYKLYIGLVVASGTGDNVNTGSSSMERGISLIEIGA